MSEFDSRRSHHSTHLNALIGQLMKPIHGVVFSARGSDFYDLMRKAALLPVGLAALVVAVSIGQLKNVEQHNRRVEHSDQVISQITAFQKSILDVETGLRGFLLNQEREFLEPYHHGLSDIPRQMATLKRLVSDSSTQTAQLAQIQLKTDLWLTAVENAIDRAQIRMNLPPKASIHSSQRNPKKSYHDLALGNRGRHTMDSLRSDVEQFVAEERSIRLRRSKMATRASKIADYSILILATILGGSVAVFTRRSLRTLASSHQKVLNELKTQADALHESREWFSITLHSIGDAVIVVNTRSQVSFMNAVAESLTGWKLSEAQGQPMSAVFNIVQEETRQPAFNPVERVLAAGVTVGLANHTLLIRRDGKEFPIEDSAAPIKSAEGECLGVVLVFRDVTDEKLRINLISESQRKFEAIFAGSATPLVFFRGKNLEFEMYNDKFSELLPERVLQGRPLLEVMPELKGSTFPEILQSVMETGRSVLTYEELMPVLNPYSHQIEARYFDSAVSQINDQQGKPYGIFVQSNEVTERVHTRMKLEQAVSARDGFLSIASHELKTPITGMRLQVQMMKRSLIKNDPSVFSKDRVTKLIRQTDDGLNRMSRLVDDMLDISRIQGGKLNLHWEPTDLIGLIRDSLDRFSAELSSVGIESKFTSELEQCVISLDRFRIDQVFTNLITNTIRYASRAPLEIMVRENKGYARIIFQDHGVGIPVGKEERIFERFERLISANEISGMGLGLYIVRQIVLAHGGQVFAEQGSSKGARFVVELPLNPERQANA